MAGAAGSSSNGGGQQGPRLRVQQLLPLLPQSVEQWRQRARAPAHSVPAEELSPSELAQRFSSDEAEVHRRFGTYGWRYGWQSVLQRGIRGQPLPPWQHLFLGLRSPAVVSWLKSLGSFPDCHLDHQPPLALSGGTADPTSVLGLEHVEPSTP